MLFVFLSLLYSQKMGKKSRVKTQKSGTGATASVSPKETLNLTSELLQSKFSPGLPALPRGSAASLLYILGLHRTVSSMVRQEVKQA